jgi:pyrroline-5-carboxylate reductase
MAGGVKFDFYRRIIKSPTPIIRIMPNLAVEQNAGVIALYSDQDIDSQIVSLFRTMGEVCVTHFEEDIDRITAISGCGLAYVFAFADCLEKAFMEVFKSTFDHLCTSLDQKKVEKIARQTVIGASLMLEHTQEKASKLQKDVASPNGITEEALKILTADDALLPLLTKTIQRAFDRSLEMGNRKI